MTDPLPSLFAGAKVSLAPYKLQCCNQ